MLAADALRGLVIATGFIERHWNAAVVFPESTSSPAQTSITIQRLIMGERLPAIREATARNVAEGRLCSVLSVFERP